MFFFLLVSIGRLVGAPCRGDPEKFDFEKMNIKSGNQNKVKPTSASTTTQKLGTFFILSQERNVAAKPSMSFSGIVQILASKCMDIFTNKTYHSEICLP